MAAPGSFVNDTPSTNVLRLRDADKARYRRLRLLAACLSAPRVARPAGR